MFRIKRYGKWLLIGIGIAALAALLRLVFVLPSTPRTERSLIAVSHPMNGVVFVARLDSDRLHPNRQQTLQLELLTAQPYNPASLKVCAQLPAEKPVCQPWPTQDGQLTHGMDLAFTPRSQTLSELLTVTILASRYPPKVKGKTTAHEVEHATFEESILRLGPLRVEKFSAATDAWLQFLARLRGILKDLTLPILIPLLGVYFAKKASKKAEQDEVRRALLGKVQGLTKQFYTHIVHHARDAIPALKAGKDDEATYNLLGALLFNFRLKEQEGAVFFSSLAAERVYANCISFLVGDVRTVLGGEQAYRRTLDDFGNLRKPKVVPPASSAPVNPSGPPALPAGADVEPPPPRLSDFLNANFLTFKLAADPVLLSTLDFLVAVTSYEYDAPLYEHWYRLPGKVIFDQPFPEAGDLHKLTAEKQKAWKSILKESRQWLADKSNAGDYLGKLPRFK